MEIFTQSCKDFIGFHLLLFKSSYCNNYAGVLNHIILVSKDGAHYTLHFIFCCMLIFCHGIHD